MNSLHDIDVTFSERLFFRSPLTTKKKSLVGFVAVGEKGWLRGKGGVEGRKQPSVICGRQLSGRGTVGDKR